MKNIIAFISALILFTSLFLFSCRKDRSCENCINGNSPPIAKAGSDINIQLPQDSVWIDGRTSYDPDGNIIAYSWTKISGPSSFFIDNPRSARTLIKNLSIGVYQFELTVTDNGGLSVKDIVIITVSDPVVFNHPPVANAGPDQLITLPANAVLLTGSSSTDPDNNIVGYSWTKISGPLSSNINNVNAVQTLVTGLVQGVYQFELKVTDSYGLFSSDTAKITVNPSSTELIFNDLPWGLWHPVPDSTWDEISIGINDNRLPNSPTPGFTVFLKRDSTSNWELINAFIGNGGPFYALFPHTLYIEVYPLDYSLLGKKASVKVIF